MRRIGFAALVVLAFVLGGLAATLLASPLQQAEAGGPKTLVIGHAAFAPGADSITWTIGDHSLASSGSMYAPIILPGNKKMTIKAVKAVVADNDAGNICVYVYKQAVTPASGPLLVTNGCTSSNSPSEVELGLIVDPINALILPTDNAWVRVTFSAYSSNLSLISVRFEY